MLRRLSRLPRTQLRAILSLTLLLIISVPAVLAGWWFYNYTSRAVAEQVDYELQSLAIHNSRLIESWLTERQFDVSVVGRLTLINTWVHAARRAAPGDVRVHDSLSVILEGRRRLFGDRYRAFRIYHKDMRPMTQAAGDGKPDSIQFAEAARGKPGISTAASPDAQSGAMLELYAPVIDAAGEIQGVLVATTEMNPMYDLLSNFAPGYTEHAHVVDTSGSLLTVSREGGEFRPGARITAGQVALLASGSPASMRYEDERGTAVRGVARSIPVLGWTLIVEWDEADAFKRVDSLEDVLWLVLGSILLLGGVLSVMIARVAAQRLEMREQELRTTHEQLIAADRLASVGMMAASIAHEINNPLTTIKVLMYSMRERISTEASHKTDLEIILSEIDKIKSLILRFLQFARPRDPEFGEVQLSETLSRIAALVRPQAMGRRQTVTETYAPGAPAVWADSSQIGQVFLNILLNAMDATPPGGEIRISTEAPDRHTVLVSIWNSGPGLAPELEERIFEPFFSTKTNGTGLGLSIARTIVEKHHGTIRARGLGDKGTVFDIRLSTQIPEKDNWNAS